MKFKISVIVPVYNEEENLENAVTKLVQLLEKECADFEIIIVDSDSKDRTREVAEKLVKKYQKVRAIMQKERKGFGNGLIEGYANAKLDYVWYVDADLPYDLNNLKKSFPFLQDYDAVIGYKIGKRETVPRSIMSFVYNRLIRLVFNLPYKDINYSYKIIKRDVLNKLDLRSDGWFVTVELLVELKNKGYKVKEVSVPFVKRIMGKSKVSSNYCKTILYFLKEIVRYKARLMRE